MNGKALILAAHGSRHEPSVNQWITDLTQSVGRAAGFQEAIAAFHQGQPHYAQAVDLLTCREVVVVPFMSSEGHFCGRVLPDQLALNQRYSQVTLTTTQPLGMHPTLPELVSRRIHELMVEHTLEPGQTTVAIVGHGTVRSPRSRLATQRMIEAVRASSVADRVIEAFLDEQPSVESIVKRSSGTAAVIVIPFLIGSGLHAVFDLPVRLGLRSLKDSANGRPVTSERPHQDTRDDSHSCEMSKSMVMDRFPMVGCVRDTLILCDRPVGRYPDIADLIVDLASSLCGVTTS